MFNFTPIMFEFAPGRFFNVQLLISIQINGYKDSYRYSFIGSESINLTPEQHSRFIEFYKASKFV